MTPSWLLDAREAKHQPEWLQQPIHRVPRGVVPGVDRPQHRTSILALDLLQSVSVFRRRPCPTTRSGWVVPSLRQAQRLHKVVVNLVLDRLGIAESHAAVQLAPHPVDRRIRLGVLHLDTFAQGFAIGLDVAKVDH